MSTLDKLAQIQPDHITRIDVYDEYRRTKLTNITDREALAAFAQGISDAVGHSPNHPRYSESWYLVLQGPDIWYEFTLHLNPRFPHSVIGYSDMTSGSSTLSRATFESRRLRPWVEENLMNLDALPK